MIFKRKSFEYILNTQEQDRLRLKLPVGVKIGKKQLCVFLNSDESVVGYINKCPHAGARLSNGWINEKGNLVCPVHRFEFDIDSGQSKDGEGLCLREIKVEVDGNVLRLMK